MLLVDDLVSDAIVAHASLTARIVYVGKRGGCKSTPRHSQKTHAAGRAGMAKTLVRLKGGDPFTYFYGRGGEEVEHLRAAQASKSKEFVGITAGLAALTGLGAPLTHRAHARGVVFITGHSQPGADDTPTGPSSRRRAMRA